MKPGYRASSNPPKNRVVAQLRKAFKPQRADRFCPRCKRKTDLDGQGVARCICGWFAGCTLTLPPVYTRDPKAQSIITPGPLITGPVKRGKP